MVANGSVWPGLALVGVLLLGGCGGGSGGTVASTPVPTVVLPTPATPETAFKVLTSLGLQSGTQTLQSAEIATTGQDIYYPQPAVTTQSFGNGLTVTYAPSPEAMTLTARNGTSRVFVGSDLEPGSYDTYAKFRTNLFPPSVSTNNLYGDTVWIEAPSVEGVSLSYTRVVEWQNLSGTTQASMLVDRKVAVTGLATQPSSMPRTGSASYATKVTAAGRELTATGAGAFIGLTNYATATFTADFGSGKFNTALALKGINPGLPSSLTKSYDFGVASGSGLISSTGPGFSGAFSGGYTGVIEGAFFGPNAAEMGYAFTLSGPTFTGNGWVAGRKQ